MPFLKSVIYTQFGLKSTFCRRFLNLPKNTFPSQFGLKSYFSFLFFSSASITMGPQEAPLPQPPLFLVFGSLRSLTLPSVEGVTHFVRSQLSLRSRILKCFLTSFEGTLPSVEKKNKIVIFKLFLN